MLTFFNEQHSQQLSAADGIQRIDAVLAELGRRGLGRIVTPQGVPLMSLERVHSPRYLHFLRTAWNEWLSLSRANADATPVASGFAIRGMRADTEPQDFNARLGLYSADATTMLSAGTWIAAKTGADCAVNAAHALRLGERSTFVLTRPAGHFAGADYFTGGCYLNNAALAAQHLLDDGLQRVAVLDLDYHHGSGTQSIFYDRADVLCISLHADPRHSYPFFTGYPDETGAGAGHGYNANLTLAPQAASADWFAALETACLRLSMYRPEALVVALGTNTFYGEPHHGFGLQTADYLRIGERLAWLGMPACFVFEGGSALRELGVNTVNVLEGFETAL